MPAANHGAKKQRFSKAELKVQAMARRRANSQLMRVPWTRFCRAYEEYPRWQALVLWVQAIIGAQDGIPSWLVADLRERCRGFIVPETRSREKELVALHLLEWIHNQEFGNIKRQGWLDALTYYGGRHPRSEGAWAHGEHCEAVWRRKPPKVFPTFDEWWHKALQVKLFDDTGYSEVARAIEEYSDWQALVLWLHPLFASDLELPSHVISELERRCPDILKDQDSTSSGDRQRRFKMWRRLIRRGTGPCILEAKQAGWLDSLLQRARSHPHYVRILAYGKHWAREWPRNRQRPYPSFHQWRQAADRYIDVDLG